ncbi:ferric reductase like transmembrane component [Lasiosphaeria ovina]|uniref:Ferric reductase like transmembrane component n=1 Tax=Lasiosphaeria ovina TaxID=92902 RepID=A0AAE0KID0_9PEZI|nr:ferric reductase like transmembrane component [Lasiosphaeria ovina]
MGWPYRFLDLTETEKHLRRLALDQYASYAQLSSLLPLCLAILYRIIQQWDTKEGTSRQGVSPLLRAQSQKADGVRASQVRKVQWWLGEEVLIFGSSWGQRDQWLVGLLWGSWLLLLCVLDTGHDYLHLTKRLGVVAVSQYPAHYLLALKSLNPFSYIFRSSHDQANRWHRVLGRIITTLIAAHVALYLNFFVQTGITTQRLLRPVVFVGVVAFCGLSLLNTTSLRAVRRYSYRLFFIIHLFVALAMPPLLFFHARPARLFMAEAFLLFIADLVSRRSNTVLADATLAPVPGTNLVKISASIPRTEVNRFHGHPGSHIYLTIPSAARKSAPASISPILYEYLFNPFTVAAVDEGGGHLTIVARHRKGPMTATLAHLASKAAGGALSSGSSCVASTIRGEDKIPLSIEGPYGIQTVAHLAGDGGFDRVLLVAGGIGATFTVPLYRFILRENRNAKVQMVWSVRQTGDMTWVASGSGAKGDIMDDENVHIFLTGGGVSDTSEDGDHAPSKKKPKKPVGSQRTESLVSKGVNGVGVGGDGGLVEMTAMLKDRRRNRPMPDSPRKRPDLKTIVDGVFKKSQEERVAVIVCGPAEMARELRGYVGVWVMKGRTVWWHNEGFGV